MQNICGIVERESGKTKRILCQPFPLILCFGITTNLDADSLEFRVNLWEILCKPKQFALLFLFWELKCLFRVFENKLRSAVSLWVCEAGESFNCELIRELLSRWRIIQTNTRRKSSSLVCFSLGQMGSSCCCGGNNVPNWKFPNQSTNNCCLFLANLLSQFLVAGRSAAPSIRCCSAMGKLTWINHMPKWFLIPRIMCVLWETILPLCWFNAPCWPGGSTVLFLISCTSWP